MKSGFTLIFFLVLFSACSSSRYGHLTVRSKKAPAQSQPMERNIQKAIDTIHLEAKTLVLSDHKDPEHEFLSLPLPFISVQPEKNETLAFEDSHGEEMKNVKTPYAQPKATSDSGYLVVMFVIVVVLGVLLLAYLGLVWWKIALLILLGVLLGALLGAAFEIFD